VVTDCALAGGDLLEHLYTEDVARDLEAIRLALGSEKLNYLGFSYGTHIGQEYAELFGDRIRAMALDGVVDPALGFEEFLIGQAEAFDAAFERQAGACEETGEPTCGVDDLVEAYDDVVAATEGSEIDNGGVPLQPAQVATAATYAGYISDGWMLLGPALGEALAGDGTGIAELAASYSALGAYGPYAGVVCTDSVHPDGLAAYQEFTQRMAEVSPRFGGSIANEMLPCATWPVGPQDTAVPLTAPDAPPILVVGNTGDPATPLVNAESVADSLASGVLLVVDSEGHTAHGSNACATEIIDAYLIDLEVPEPGTRC
jgi:pimeloyl-ACP methyl ester carboxylesterase